MKTIREIRGEYNVLFEELIDNLINNPDNIERTLQIIEEMEALDEFPNERVVQQVDDARVIAQLAYDRTILDRTMDLAQAQLSEISYADAVRTYLELVDFQRIVFESRGYGDIFRNSVDGAVGLIEVNARDFIVQFPAYSRSGRALTSALDSATIVNETLYSSYIDTTTGIHELLGGVTEGSQDLAILRTQVALQFPDDPVDWYLNFQDIIARGRTDFRDSEGVDFAIRTALEEYNSEVRNRLTASANTQLDVATEEAARDRFATARDIYRLADSLLGNRERVLSASKGYTDTAVSLDDAIERLGAANTEELLDIRSGRATAQSLVKLYTNMDVIQRSSQNRAGTQFTLESRRDALFGIYAELERDFADWTDAREVLAGYPAIPEPRVAFSETATRAWRRRLIEAAESGADLVVQIAQLKYEPVTEAINRQSSIVEDLRPLIDGVEEETQNDLGEVSVRTSRYPDRALAEVARVAEDLESAKTAFAAMEAEFAAAPEFVRSRPRYRTEANSISTIAESLGRTDEETEAIVLAAQNLIAQSDEYRSTGDRRVQDSRAAIRGLLITTAKDNWDAARDAYYASLDLREDDEFRTFADDLIRTLGEEIQEAENVVVVRRVRELLISAQGLYDRDEYAGSRDVLLQATQLWEQTNVEPNAEISRLLRLVTAALSLEEGRELTVTDPLYPILGNYLSIAKEDFNSAMELNAAGSVADADRLFDRSLENLRNVRDVRPLNWEARILELRIAQVRSDEDFDAVFESRYNQALGRLGETSPVEVYAELEVLAEINPDYPGIQQEIHRLEITLNLREDPVDQARIAQANTLVRRAETLAANGGTDEALVAVSLLEEAVTINPGDSAAQFLLDELRIKLGGQAQVALASADEQQYRRAETLFSQGRVLQALAIVERLIAVPSNQDYPPLVDLRRRISLRLGI